MLPEARTVKTPWHKATAQRASLIRPACPEMNRVQQFLLFFTDGQPTAFRGGFTYNGANYDGVAQVLSLNPQLSDCYQVDNYLYGPNSTTNGYLTPYVPAVPTGNGASNSSTLWQVFAQYPVAGYAPTANVPNTSYGPLPTYVCTTGRSLAIAQATILKNRNVKIYTIRPGNVDRHNFFVSGGQRLGV